MNLASSLAIVVAGLMVVLFQNCGATHDAPLTGEELSTSQAADLDRRYLSALMDDAHLSLVIRNSVTEKQVQPFFADASSVILAIDPTKTGEVFALRSSAGGEEARLRIADGMIWATHASDDGNWSARKGAVPAGGQKVIVAVSFGVDESEIQLLINGTLQTQALTVNQAPVDFNYLMKEPAFNNPPVQALLYGRNLSAAELNVAARWMGREMGLNTVVYDPNVSSPPAETPRGSALFLAARSIIENRCVSCHNSGAIGDFRNLSEDQFVSAGFVVRGSPEASKLYFRLIGAQSGAGPRNMPSNSAALSAQEVTAMEDWIRSIP